MKGVGWGGWRQPIDLYIYKFSKSYCFLRIGYHRPHSEGSKRSHSNACVYLKCLTEGAHRLFEGGGGVNSTPLYNH